MMAGRRVLGGLLAAQAVSLTGTQLSMIALPWFVLVSTGSPTRTGLVAFCELGAYVVARAASGPLIDQVGPSRVSVTADLASAVVVGAVPVLHAADLLPLPTLLALVAAAGTARGPGDTAKSTLVPSVADAAGLPLERVTGLYGTVDRLAQVGGPLLAGAVVAGFGPLTALLIDGASFAISAAVVAATIGRDRRSATADSGRYRQPAA
jgi:nitrate/nitrite transporter NarK